MHKLVPVDVGTLVNVLHLQAAFLVEPILKAGNCLMLIHAQCCVKVEKVI